MNLFRLKGGNYTNQKLNGSASLLVALALTCFAISPIAKAVVPAPDGGYPGFNTAEGQNALFSLTTGSANTAVGWFSLFSDTEGSFNTATGAGALLFNTADENTAFGAAALLFNTTGITNTAVGAAALLHNTIAEENTATGASALSSNTEGELNTATGAFALFGNTTGAENTANGLSALSSNTTGGFNTALGAGAGAFLTTGSGNVCIGANVHGVAGESSTTRILNIYPSFATGRVVYVDSDNKIGTLGSSRRFKEEIKPMDKASEALFALKPVTFRYKKQIDPMQALSFGLIAEEVAKINPELITRDHDGKPETVRYEAVNAMLLNEFLKEHRKVEEQEATIAQQRKDFEAAVAELKKELASVTARLKEHDSKIQKVNDWVKAVMLAQEVVLNSP